jgi:hypothetical protein
MQIAEEKIERFLLDWPEAESGPAHIVLADLNLEDYWIHSCLQGCEKSDRPADEIKATVAFLQELLQIPEDDRCEGLDYTYLD